MGWWKKIAGNTPTRVVLEWTALVVLWWPAMVVLTVADKLYERGTRVDDHLP